MRSPSARAGSSVARSCTPLSGAARTARTTAPWTYTCASCATNWSSRYPNGASYIRTSGSAIGSSPSFHTFFTTQPQGGNRLPPGCCEPRPRAVKRRRSYPLRSRIWLALAAVIALAFAVSACGSDDSSSGGGGGSRASINGAGSTFAAPIYQQWGNALKDQGVTVNYQPVGSGAGVAPWQGGPGHLGAREPDPAPAGPAGAGVAQWQAATADFGASDPALAPEDRKGAKKGAGVQIPTAFGAITVAYNLSGVPKGLKLDGATVADIFLGKIKKWNDPAIAKLNPGAKLPDTDITVVHRSDESGTTKGFTGFLSDYSPEWKSKVGSDKTVKWPTGTGAKGNDGVAAGVKQQPGSVGYVEEAYALQNNFTTASVKNKSGKFAEPTLDSTTAAGEGIKIPKDLGIDVINSPNPAAYPISSQTFVIVYKDMCKAGISQGTAQAVKKFVDYGLSDGQGVLQQLQYGQLPAPLKTKAQSAADSLQCNGSPLKAG